MLVVTSNNGKLIIQLEWPNHKNISKQKMKPIVGISNPLFNHYLTLLPYNITS